jgi:hypothetical protein
VYQALAEAAAGVDSELPWLLLDLALGAPLPVRG